MLTTPRPPTSFRSPGRRSRHARRSGRAAISLLIAPLFWLSAAPAAAFDEYPHTREGFFIGVGLGWGNAGADLTVVEKVDRESGGTGNFRLGWALGEYLALGFEFNAWASQFQGDTVSDLRWVFSLSSIALTAWPVKRGPYVRGGVGIGTTRVELDQGVDSIVRQDKAGTGYSIAVGYEVRIQEHAALGPQFEYAYLDIGGNITRDVNYFSLTIQLTGYW